MRAVVLVGLIGSCFGDTCQSDTGGTCAILPCKSKRGATDCIDGKCICQAGYCATSHGILNTGTTTCECNRQTGGSCHLVGCASWRGPTDCLNGHCACKPGTCAEDGKCVEAAKKPEQFEGIGTCSIDTGGTCRFFGCKSSRGATRCHKGECLCQPGYCNNGGTCTCPTDTGGSCRFMGCSSSRGPTDCINHRCVCKPGTCSQDGKCMNAPAFSLAETDTVIDDIVSPSLSVLSAVFLASALLGMAVASVAYIIFMRKEAKVSDEPLLG